MDGFKALLEQHEAEFGALHEKTIATRLDLAVACATFNESVDAMAQQQVASISDEEYLDVRDHLRRHGYSSFWKWPGCGEPEHDTLASHADARKN